MESTPLRNLKSQILNLKRIFFRDFFLVLILLLAAFLRLYRISGQMEFLGDQGRDVLIVQRFLKKGDLMFIGPQTSIGGMYLGPWYYYLMAPALLLANFNPVGPSIMVALIGVATVWLAYKVGKEWFNKETGVLAALLTAISPVIVYYSIFSWNPNVMPFFALLSIWLTWRIWQKNEFKKLPWLGFSLGMVLNSHYLGLLLLPLVAFFWFLALKKNWHKKTQKHFILHTSYFILILFFLMSPLILFDLKHDFLNFKAFKQFFMIRQTTVNLKFYKGFLKLPIIVSQLFANLLAGKDYLAGIYWLLLFLGLGIWKLRKNKNLWFILAWLLVGILGISNYKQHVFAHYFGFLWPVAVLLAALFLKKTLPFSLPIIAYLAWLSLSNWHGWQPANSQLKRAREVSDFICQQTKQAEKYNIVNLAAYNDFRAMPYRYFLTKDCPRPVMVDTSYPDARSLYVVQEDPSKYPDPVGADVWEIQSGGNWEVENEWVVFDTKIYRLTKKG